MNNRRSFWSTLPGILTGIAAVITAIGATVGILYQTGIIGPKSFQREPSISRQVREPTKPEETAEEKRPVTYYTAKQAFARLEIYLSENNYPPLKVIWFVSPARITMYSFESKIGELLKGAVSARIFGYEDINGETYLANLNCWGEVKVEKEGISHHTRHYPAPIEPHLWILDDIDAYRTVISFGGEGKKDHFGCSLITIKVKDRGIRPIWDGQVFFMPQKEYFIAVDAQTGELYSRIADKEAEPIALTKLPYTEWNGGFDKESAIMKGKIDYYLWPRGYKSDEGWTIYNRNHLKTLLREEESKPIRSASSWMTTGILHAVLGNYVEAIDNLSEAIQKEPKNPDYLFYRGFCFLIIRDLQKASSDFHSFPQDYKERDDFLKYLKVFKGEKESDLLSHWRSIMTDVGRIPLEIWIGPHPIHSWIQKLHNVPLDKQ